MPRAVLAFSGGLDTSYCVAWLREERGLEVITVTVDTGGLAPADRDALAARSVECGAADHVLVDGRARVAGYPHLTGQDERYLLAQLRAFRSGERENPMMRSVLGALSDAVPQIAGQE